MSSSANSYAITRKFCSLQAAKLLKVADDGAPYPAPAETRPKAGVVYSAAAEVLKYDDWPLDHKPPVVTYKSTFAQTIWQFPSNDEKAREGRDAAEPTVSSSLSDDGKSGCLQHCFELSFCVPLRERRSSWPCLSAVRAQLTHVYVMMHQPRSQQAWYHINAL